MPDLPATHHSGPVGLDAMTTGLVSGPKAGTKCRLLHKCWLRTVANAATSGMSRCGDAVVHDHEDYAEHDGDGDDDDDEDGMNIMLILTMLAIMAILETMSMTMTIMRTMMQMLIFNRLLIDTFKSGGGRSPCQLPIKNGTNRTSRKSPWREASDFFLLINKS